MCVHVRVFRGRTWLCGGTGMPGCVRVAGTSLGPCVPWHDLCGCCRDAGSGCGKDPRVRRAGRAGRPALGGATPTPWTDALGREEAGGQAGVRLSGSRSGRAQGQVCDGLSSSSGLLSPTHPDPLAKHPLGWLWAGRWAQAWDWPWSPRSASGGDMLLQQEGGLLWSGGQRRAGRGRGDGRRAAWVGRGRGGPWAASGGWGKP